MLQAYLYETSTLFELLKSLYIHIGLQINTFQNEFH